MTQSETATDAAGWEPEIRALEEQARVAFLNVWQLDNGRWRSIARHAHVVSRGATG